MTRGLRIAALLLAASALLAGCGRQGAPQLSPEQMEKRGPQAPVRIVPPNTQTNGTTAPKRPFFLDKLL